MTRPVPDSPDTATLPAAGPGAGARSRGAPAGKAWAAEHPNLFSFRFSAMASACELRLHAPDAGTAGQLARLAMAEVQRIEHAYSRYRDDSIVSRLNRAAGSGAWIALDGETAALLDYAHALHTGSEGLFDATSGVLRRAWDFRGTRLPEPGQLEALLPLVGWHQVERRPHAARLLRAGMELDFGGFGKEYAADRAAALLARHGVRHGYVNLGGDLHVIGPQPGGQPWNIGIQDPRHGDRTCAEIPVSSGGLATSGDYERFMVVDGQRYCHILNPRTGYPCRHWRSISVVGALAVAAGSLATIAMLKEDAALAYLDKAGVSYLAIDHQGGLHQACA
jgi:thiamine biosynthesis lipoprotein